MSMSEQDRAKWDQRYAEGGMAPLAVVGPPPPFGPYEHLIPTTGTALEIACGRGRAGTWLAQRGLDYFGVDISPVAIKFARDLALARGLADRARFAVHDLDRGLPDGPEVDLVFCYKFRDPTLDAAMMQRLQKGGILVIAVLSEVGAGPGAFRAKPGELSEAFSPLETQAAGEGDGMAWLIGRK